MTSSQAILEVSSLCYKAFQFQVVKGELTKNVFFNKAPQYELVFKAFFKQMHGVIVT